MLGSDKLFVITLAWNHDPGRDATYQCSEPSVIPLSYPGTITSTLCPATEALTFTDMFLSKFPSSSQGIFAKIMGHSRPLFLYFRLFYKQITVYKCSIKVADYWIRTRVLWYWKQLLNQLCHNHRENFLDHLFAVDWLDRKDNRKKKTRMGPL